MPRKDSWVAIGWSRLYLDFHETNISVQETNIPVGLMVPFPPRQRMSSTQGVGRHWLNLKELSINGCEGIHRPTRIVWSHMILISNMHAAQVL